MNIKKYLIGNIAYRLPQCALKNSLKCYYYNNFIKCNFKSEYNNDYFIYSFKNGISFKCYDSIFVHFVHPLENYLYKYKLKEGDTVIDCGAHYGAFALYAAKAVGENGTILAFEPDSINYKKLIKNIKLNNLNNVITINKGIWSKNTELEFNNLHTGCSSFVFDGNTDAVIKLPVVTIDSELKNQRIKKIDFIKMDVEGAELEIVKGAKKTLKDYDVNLAIASYHVLNGEKTYIKLEKMLSGIGYKTKTCNPSHLTTYAYKK